MDRFGGVLNDYGVGDAERRGPAAATELRWERHVRAFLVWLPVLPVVGVSVLHPASGVLSDSFAAAGGAGWPLLAAWTYATATLVEFLALTGRSAWILVAVPAHAGVVLTTIGQALLTDTNECDAYCVLHLFFLLAYAVTELVALWARGYTVRALAPYAVSVVALGIWYRTVLEPDNFDAADPGTLQRLRIAGALEIAAFVVARSLVAGV